MMRLDRRGRCTIARGGCVPRALSTDAGGICSVSASSSSPLQIGHIHRHTPQTHFATSMALSAGDGGGSMPPPPPACNSELLFGALVGKYTRFAVVMPSDSNCAMKNGINSLPFSKLAPYCLTANFSTAASKPKNECTISDAFCSKHVQSAFSGCSCTQRML